MARPGLFPAAQAPDASGRNLFTVSQVTHLVKSALERNLAPLWIVGEVTNLRLPASGHAYFTLKDEACQIRAVAWRGTMAHLRFQLQDGMSLVCYGLVSVYESRGEYQIVTSRLEPQGVGALELAFRQMKEKLEKEGLFDPARKRPLPFLPRRLALVTSSSGAAVQDMLKVITNRCPAVEILVVPVRVQGEGAAQEIAEAIRLLNARPDLGVEVMIVGRGGGSLEDLWAFNEEVVARAIFESGIPVISAVGHEIDVSIADLVADRRALTPTAAGEMVVPDLRDLLDRLETIQVSLKRSARNRFAMARLHLDSLKEAYGFRRLMDRLRERAQSLDEARSAMGEAASGRLQRARERLQVLGGRLEDLSPLKVLGRGYAILNRVDGRVVRAASDAAPGDPLKARLGKGSLALRVEGGTRRRPSRPPKGPGLFD
jgi:exodeoxyribonuclease VII large subunit